MRNQIIKIGEPYKFGGRPTLIPVKIHVRSDSRRVIIEAYRPDEYKQWLKFYTYHPPTRQTIAVIEGIAKPKRTTIRVNMKTLEKMIANNE